MAMYESNSGNFYLLEAFSIGCSNGNAYVMEDTLFRLCRRLDKSLTSQRFREDLSREISNGILFREGRRIYEWSTWRYEESAARDLGSIMEHPGFPIAELPDTLMVGDVELCIEQRNAVAVALSNRLSLILGGAGCGKSTLIRAICDQLKGGRVLCAPTGKAARNLATRTGLSARTVHSALGMAPHDDFLSPVEWVDTQLVIVDEASMVSLEMLAGILHHTTEKCRVVLLGDPNQLLSVGTGNVIPDLLALGVPVVRLKMNHRQSQASAALLKNVVEFTSLRRSKDLLWDESFVFHPMHDQAALDTLIEDAVQMYQAGENVQVLAPYNQLVSDLNREIRERVNPKVDDKRVLTIGHREFRDGDKVLITKNCREFNCSNGDVGILHIVEDSRCDCSYYVDLPDGRKPLWHSYDGLHIMTLAYAMTVHKSQGSEYDAILMPMFMSMHRMLFRNLLYTSISRGKRKVILYGDPEALDVAMQKSLPQRRSMLVTKTHLHMHRCA